MCPFEKKDQNILGTKLLWELQGVLERMSQSAWWLVGASVGLLGLLVHQGVRLQMHAHIAEGSAVNYHCHNMWMDVQMVMVALH